MKRFFFVISLICISSLSFSQKSQPVQKDTMVRVTVNLNEYRVLLYKLDVNIDSKGETKSILDFLRSKAEFILPKADTAKVIRNEKQK